MKKIVLILLAVILLTVLAVAYQPVSARPGTPTPPASSCNFLANDVQFKVTHKQEAFTGMLYAGTPLIGATPPSPVPPPWKSITIGYGITVLVPGADFECY